MKSWWYPPAIALGTVLLAGLSLPWKKLTVCAAALHPTTEDIVDDEVELVPAGYSWLLALMLFVAIAVIAVELTGLRFILFPPLVVIGFEMFGHTALCPWAKRPLLLPLACFLTAAGGLFFWKLSGGGPAGAACGMASGIVVLRVFDLHVPPALAVALIPFVMDTPTIAYPLSVGVGTLLMTLWFFAYKWLFGGIQNAN